VSQVPGTPVDSGDCCPPAAHQSRIAKYFDGKTSDALGAGALPAMADVSADLLAELEADVGDEQPTVLELGCGSGALLVALLEQGASSATGIDLSPVAIDTARRRAAEAGLEAGRAMFSVGDAAHAQLEAHGWVVLDRAICCYGDAGQLMLNAVGAATQRLAYSVPESRGLRGLVNRVMWSFDNVWGRLRPPYVQGFVHDVRSIDRLLQAADFRLLRERRAGLWRVAVFARE
jgi:SAM-dependent methyltransferase